MDQQPQVQRIGRYEVVRKIATGGMAELFLARYSGPGGFEKRCALKRILPQFAADEAFTRMFLTEAKITAQLDHPNIVQIFELGQDDSGQYFIAMEMVNGVNLRQLLTMASQRQQSVPPELAAYIVLQALEGLTYAHEMRDRDGEPLNLVHRDISPQNILVSYEGAVKLVDFGIVKGSSISGETQTGMLKGKVAYMSPEQATGEALDGRSDLFALAVVLYELIAGERPFIASNELMTLKAILEEPPQPLIFHVPECPEGIERAIFRGLAKFPQQRFINARAFHAELDNVLRACPVPLGRHVVAEYVQSLTEGSTVPFDASRLKIPRRASVGFSHHLMATASPPLGGAPVAAAESFESFEAGPPTIADGQGPTPHHDVNGTFGSGAAVHGQNQTDAFDSSAAMAAPIIGVPLEAADATIATAVPKSPATVNFPTVDGSSPNHQQARRPSLPLNRSISVPSELAPEDLRAAGVRRWSWLPLFFVILALAGWLAGWLYQRSQIEAIIVAPIVPPPRIEQVFDPAPSSSSEPIADKPTPPDTPSKRKESPVRKKRTPAKRKTAESKTSNKERTAPLAPEPKSTVRASEADASRSSSARGLLELQTEPSGLVVRKDGKKLGTTPLSVAMNPGSHTLLLRSRRRGVSREVTVNIEQGKTAQIKVELQYGVFKVLSRPWAEVFLDGKPLGKTPLTVDAYEGKHQLKLVSPDGDERTQTIIVEPGDNPIVRVLF